MRQRFLYVITAALLCATVFILGVSARAGCNHDISAWTNEQLHSFMDKYGITHRQKDKSVSESVADTVKYYKDAAATNAEIFGTKVDHVIDGLKIKLEQQRQLSENNVANVIEGIQHRLRRLELQGELSRDRVAETLDRMHREAVQKKIVTESQWSDIYNDVLSSFEQRQAWYQRVINRKTDEASSSLNRWLQGVHDRLVTSASLTEKQANDVIANLRNSLVSTTDVSHLGNKRFYHHLKHELQKKGDLRKDQIKTVMDQLHDDVTAYKVFAMDYLGDKYSNAQEWADDMGRKIKDTGSYTMDRVYDWINYIDGHVRAYLPTVLGGHREFYDKDIHNAKDSAYDTIRSAVSSVAADWKGSASAAARSKASIEAEVSSSASSLHSEATDTINDWHKQFSDYWYDQEREFYRRMGYTEAQIEWVQHYLSKAFKDEAALTKSQVDRTLENIAHYLEDTRTQSRAQVQHQIDQLRLLIEQWRHKACEKGHCY
ncbi:hypothetical protein K492DRAFT_239422 [Lichtheimia hyalospora FSU 10163]|nr:hypothetical protein K492DRAFT_239422 [Lichtheimia hyalospora FSU 10163]